MAFITYICGIDGSGKTSLTSTCSARLKQKGYRSKVLYLGGLHAFNFSIFPLIAVVKGLGADLNDDRFRVIRRALWPPLLLLVYSAYFMMKTRFLSRLWKPGYLFFDRYTLDVVIEMMVATDIPNPLKSFALRALLSFPCPQLCVNLDVDENIAQARKKDEIHTAEWLKARRVVYRSITSRFSYLQMDSSRPQSELADSIMSIILKGKQE